LSALAAVLTASFHFLPSYGLAFSALAVIVSLATWPLTHRAARSQVAMARLQPKLDEVRRRFRHDPVKLGHETRAVYQAAGVAPLAGCGPATLGLPLAAGVYRLVRGLTHRAAAGGVFEPHNLPHGTRLFKAMASSHTMRSWGVDLAQTGLAALHAGPVSAAVFILLMAATMGSGLAQQRLARRRGRAAAGGRALGLVSMLFGLWGLMVPAGLGLYYAVSNSVRVLQQWLALRAIPPAAAGTPGA
jgi:YidC/Oxa1 family membrane protein insertase